MNYCLQRKEKYLGIFTKKRLNKIDELSKKIDYGDLKFILNSIGLETDFSK